MPKRGPGLSDGSSVIVKLLLLHFCLLIKKLKLKHSVRFAALSLTTSVSYFNPMAITLNVHLIAN